MDPLSQGALGAVAAQNTSQVRWIAVATLLGFVSGLAPDLDVLIRSETDPLLFLEYHRQFTHSILFIPVGGFLCAATLHLLVRKWSPGFRLTLTYCTLGYASHGLLDACTSYGTQLFWPFSDARIAWSSISIVDPLFTLPLLSLIGLAVYRRRKTFARLAGLWVLVYLGLGFVQHERAEAAGRALAASRYHQVERLEVKPAFGNLLLWKVVYEATGHFHVDGVRLGIRPVIYPGRSIEKLNTKKHFAWLDNESQQAEDIRRFSWFSDGYLAVHPRHSDRIIDVRYSFLPNRIGSMWMIELDPDKDATAHVSYLHEPEGREGNLPIIWRMITGNYDEASR